MIASGDRAFSGSIAQMYERYLVPLIFEPYAQDMARRVALLAPQAMLEIAAGTGVVTRHLAQQLPSSATIVATDLNQPMLDHAMGIGTVRPVTWRQADAMSLPFDDASFDVVACQFGAMFFPDKAVAFAEARRVLRPGGTFLFNVWDRIEDNEFAQCVTDALAERFPDDPPRFLARLPHGYHDERVIASALVQGGFTAGPRFETVTARSVSDSARTVAIAFCQGTPLRNEIETRDAGVLDGATHAAQAALARRFGTGAIDGKIQAIVVAAPRGTG